MNSILEVKHAEKRFGGVRALVDANLTHYPASPH